MERVAINDQCRTEARFLTFLCRTAKSSNVGFRPLRFPSSHSFSTSFCETLVLPTPSNYARPPRTRRLLHEIHPNCERRSIRRGWCYHDSQPTRGRDSRAVAEGGKGETGDICGVIQAFADEPGEGQE